MCLPTEVYVWPVFQCSNVGMGYGGRCVSLTFKGFGWCFRAAGGFWNKHTLSKHLDIKACIVERHLWVFFQLLGQVGSRCGGCCIGPVAAILRDLQLLHKTHRPGTKFISGTSLKQNILKKIATIALEGKAVHSRSLSTEWPSPAPPGEFWGISLFPVGQLTS